MKKIIITATFLLIGICAASAQNSRFIDFRAGIYVGSNLSEDNPIAGGFVSAQSCNVMLEVDMGWSRLNQPQKDFFYFSPALGFYLGNKVRFYGLVGITNWGGIDLFDGSFSAKYFWWKVKAGVEVPLSNTLFITANWQYLFDSKRADVLPFENNSLSLGLGFYF